ncbi:hypothetical protein POTOM_009498 [Populus tomentosa]|uniref:Uncharacterized protein n=1 Tax=Populus tomentosa TaxID=118781 RepID=A0A8X8A8P9_POPTO|nr:hypothetical protein POTOM_009498 [Populus tomentosa]
MELRFSMDVKIGRAFPLSSDFLKFNELWVAGGPAANALKPKFGLFASREQTHAGIQVPEIEVRISAIEKFERDWPFSLCHATHHMTNPGYKNMETLLGRTVGVILKKFEIKAVKRQLRYMYAKIKHLSTAVIFLEGICGILVIFGSSLGAYLLVGARNSI